MIRDIRDIKYPRLLNFYNFATFDTKGRINLYVEMLLLSYDALAEGETLQKKCCLHGDI